MATPLQLQNRLDSIETAIASGATSVSYEGKTVQYRTLAEMVKVRDSLLSQLGQPTQKRRTVAAFNGGFW